jgi:hypothetical protein
MDSQVRKALAGIFAADFDRNQLQRVLEILGLSQSHALHVASEADRLLHSASPGAHTNGAGEKPNGNGHGAVVHHFNAGPREIS